jgi:GT2 family glycosyltransferase
MLELFKLTFCGLGEQDLYCRFDDGCRLMEKQGLTLSPSPENGMLDNGGLNSENGLSDDYAENTAVFIKEAKSVSFDTYFNCFSYNAYLKHTKTEKLILSISGIGSAAAELYLSRLKKSVDAKYYYTTLRESEKSSCDKLSELELASLAQTQRCASFTFEKSFEETRHYYEFDLSELKKYGETGYLYLKITALNGDFILTDGRFFSETETPNDIKVGMVICTYKRERYVLENLKRISGFIADSPCALEVFVIDNGNTLTHDDIKPYTHFAHLIPNRNLGGSGGFSRGIFEIINRKNEGFTHFLLTDDDISFDTSVLNKTFNMLACAKNPDELCVGAAMLLQGRRTLQYEMGADWDGLRVKSIRSGFDISKPYAILKNEEEATEKYSAWWYMCMPVSVVPRFGMPLPMFIKCDDVEYGLRCINELALVNGIGVWHEPFDKKYSAELEYYVKRNELITAILYNKRFLRNAAAKLIRSTARLLIYQRYFALDYIFRAYSDFLKGPDFLLNTPADILHAKLREANVKYLSREKLESLGYKPREIYLPSEKSRIALQIVTLNGYLIPYAFYGESEKSDYVTVDMTSLKPKQFYKRKNVLQYDFTTESGFVTHQQKGQLFKAGFKIISLLTKLVFMYPKTKHDWKKGFDKISTLEYWNETFHSDKH